MEARLLRAAIAASALLFMGASYRTPNFVVTAPTPQFAEQVGKEAERFRRELATLWLGQPLPKWSQPCPITLQVGPNLGAGGATSFVFDRGEVFRWEMSIQGSEERILDSVLPHEVTHTIFASYFRQPLPRWADEGACTTVEHESERAKQRQMLISFLKEDRGIAFSRMFAMKEYPPDVMPLYAQGYSLCRFLIEQRDRRTFIQFLSDGLETNAWTQALDSHYGFKNLAQLQDTWLDWVRAGSPLQRQNPEQGNTTPLLAATTSPAAAAPVPEPAPAASPASQAVAAAPARAMGPLVPVRRPDQPVASDAALAAVAASHEEPSPIDSTPGAGVPSPSAYASQAVQLTRPQPIQRPQQRVLEWSQPSANPQVKPGVEATGMALTAPMTPEAVSPPGTARPIRLSASAAQRYLPAAMSRSQRGRPQASNTGALPGKQSLEVAAEG